MTEQQADPWDRYQRAEQRLLALIRGERRDSPSRDERLRRAAARLQRTRDRLTKLGNPQQRYPVVHVTGTSGKGSTCAAVAAVLTAAGYRVGLRTSPFVQVATEKLQIGSSLIDAHEFAEHVDRVLAIGRGPSDRGATEPTMSYAEAWAGVSFSWFAERAIDIAVVEVGAGGRFDATNVVDPVVSVITSVGLDHLVSLGPTLADIAWHKAGIIKPGAIAVVGAVPEEAWGPIESEIRRRGVPLMRPESHAESCESHQAPAIGFRRTNSQVASAICVALRRQGFVIPDSAIDEGLARFRLPARYERMPDRQPFAVWIDGAHNPDKIAAVAREARKDTGADNRPLVLLGLTGSKDATTMVRTIGDIASGVITTQHQVRGKHPYAAHALADSLRETGFRGLVKAIPDPDRALAAAMRLASDARQPLLVTGSLYLAGHVRRHWYADRAIVTQRTPWPLHDLP